MTTEATEWEARKQWAAAMVAFQAECPRLTKDSKVDTGSYSYNYATLDGILAHVGPILAKHGLSVTWGLASGDGTFGVICKVVHVGGHGEQSGIMAPFPKGANPMQALGSGITYLKRYTLAAALGLGTGEDDDGQGFVKGKAADADADTGWLDDMAPKQEKAEDPNAMRADFDDELPF